MGPSSLAKGYDPFYSSSPLGSLDDQKNTEEQFFWGDVFGFQYNLESIFRAFKRKEMKSSRRLAENDIFTRGNPANFIHFYFVDIFPTEHVLFVKRVLIGYSYHYI
jgi:hypothetical protein